MTSSIAITDSMFNFGKFCRQKNAITFDLTEIEGKNKYFVSMKFCAHPMLPIKML